MNNNNVTQKLRDILEKAETELFSVIEEEEAWRRTLRIDEHCLKPHIIRRLKYHFQRSKIADSILAAQSTLDIHLQKQKEQV